MKPAQRSIPTPWANALLAALAILPAATGATVIVPMSDAQLADSAPLIVEVRVLAVEPAPGTRPATDYLVAVERPIKGSVGAATLIVRLPGGVRPDGVGLHVWGAPRWRPGEEALLFLRPGGGGTWALHELALGAFRISGEAPSRIATRDLSAVRRLAVPGEAPADGARDLAAFRRWLEDRGRGRLRAPDYFLAAAAASGEPPAKFRTIVTSTEPPPLGCGESGGHGVRWFDFDVGESVGWRTHYAGQDGLPEGGLGAFRQALDAWTRDPNTPVRYVWDGLTAATGGLSEPDATNAVLFGDPNDEVPGSFDGAGLLALGGPWFECQPLRYRGESFHPVIAADVVTQDGLELFFAALPYPLRAAEQIFAHELGHTLGLAHSAEPEALMFADFHPDRRGAALDVDDLAGVLYLYGERDLEPPAPPANLEATVGQRLAVALAWSDRSDNESVFRLERRGAGDFELLATAGADATSFVDAAVAPTTRYAYRLRADNGAGASAYTAEVAVTTPEDPRPAAPSNLRAAPLSSTEVRLAWQDNSDDEMGFTLEILLGAKWLEIPVELPPDTRKAIVEGLTPATRFGFRVRAVNAFGRSATSNPAAVDTFPDDGACVVSRSELCLLGGRFRISVRFSNHHVPGEGGPATGIPSTDESGLFWFFNPENVELIVKALDGRLINGHFWLFYGALSDLEYWITVTDTVTGTTSIYHNPPREICGLADTAAFPGESPVPPPGAAAPAAKAALDVAALGVVAVAGTAAAEDEAPEPGSCAPGRERLCLLDGRLSVEVTWKNHHEPGSEGLGQAVVDTDNSGFFWFFNIENTELVVKALDGGGINGNLWIFYGALTDLEYSLTVTDTATGETRVYHNPAGEVCGRADVEAFPSVPEAPPGDATATAGGRSDP